MAPDDTVAHHSVEVKGLKPGSSNQLAWLRRPLLPLAIIVFAAAVFRLYLADHSLWFDEQASVYFSDQPISRLWSDWILRETNPPLYYSMLKAWRVFGSSDFAIRSLSVLGSVAAIVALAVVANRLYGARAAIVAAIFAALSGQHLFFAEQARAYIFVYLCVVIAIGALAAFLEQPTTRKRQRMALVLFVLASTAAIHLHTTMLLFPALAVLSLIGAHPGKTRHEPAWLIPVIGATAAIYVLSAWAVRIAILQIVYRSSNIAPIGLVGPEHIIEIAARTLFLGAHGGRMTLVLAGAITALVAVLVWRGRSSGTTRLLALLALLGLAVFAVVGTRVPIFVPRTIFWLSAPILILLAGAIARVQSRAARVAVCSFLGLCLTIDMLKVAPVLEREDWRAPVAIVSGIPGAVLLVQGEAMAVLAENSCNRLTGARCPYSVAAVIDPEDRYDTWARGGFAGSQVTVDALPEFVGSRTVFLFRKAHHHNLPDLLHRNGMGRGVPANAPPLLGPYDAAALR